MNSHYVKVIEGKRNTIIEDYTIFSESNRPLLNHQYFGSRSPGGSGGIPHRRYRPGPAGAVGYVGMSASGDRISGNPGGKAAYGYGDRLLGTGCVVGTDS